MDEIDESIYGSYVLPGSIYLFHPAIADGKKYVKYEEEKNEYVKVLCTKNVLSIVDKVVNIALRSETNPYSSRRDVFFIRAALSSDCPSFSLFHNSPQLCCV